MSFGLLSDVRIGLYGVLDAIDAGLSSFLLPLVGVLIALFVGWRLEKSIALGESELGAGWLGLCWRWVLRIAAPATIAVILLQSASVL
jgi:NSS family neurotransmitter:Na+ symporter